MLYIVLLLVLAALGLLVAALITANSLWAWISIGLSAVAAGILLVDWLARRSRRLAAEVVASAEAEDDDQTTGKQSEGEDTPVELIDETELLAVRGELDSSADVVVVPDIAEAAEHLDDSDSEEVGPGEEQTDAADLLVVSELDDEVVVVDEYPRYHLTECRWLVDRDTIPIEVSEARQLGFTPCARCRPDASIAGRHRVKRKSGADK